MGRWALRKDLFGKIFHYLDYKKMYNESFGLITKLGINIDNLKKSMLYYSGGQRQAIALSRIIYWDKKVAILDEPIVALGVRETQKTLELIKSLKEHGLSVIIISHNLQHIFSLVDRIFVIRRANRVGIKNVHETTANEIVSMITGAQYVEKV